MIRVQAPAKLNLYLAVGGVRPDGYHDVETVLVALDLCDEVTIAPADGLSLSCDTDLGVPAHANLAWRAAVAAGEALGRTPDVALGVTKRIPAGAGLGGGSADAAAVIAGLAALWDIPADEPALDRVARSLGADVPFFLRGGCALYGGRGDRHVRDLPVPGARFAVASPGVPVPTAEAYAAFDASAREAVPGVRDIGDALRLDRSATALGGALFNNMTAASVGLRPVIGDLLREMAACPGCRGVAMAGSGSTVFGVFDDDGAASAAASGFGERGVWAQATGARPDGVRVSSGEGTA